MKTAIAVAMDVLNENSFSPPTRQLMVEAIEADREQRQGLSVGLARRDLANEILGYADSLDEGVTLAAIYEGLVKLSREIRQGEWG